MEPNRSWHNSPEAVKEKREAEDRLLSDLVAHDGWQVFTRMIEDAKESMLEIILVEAENDWELVKKERLIHTIGTLDRILSQVKQRAGRYRRTINVIS